MKILAPKIGALYWDHRNKIRFFLKQPEQFLINVANLWESSPEIKQHDM
jgi:hypothetical protein